GTARRSFEGVFGDEDNGPLKWCFTIGVGLERGRKKGGVGVTTLVAAAGCRRADVRRNRLRRDFDPLAAQVVVPFLWELQLPQRGVDAHTTFVTSHWIMTSAKSG